MSEACYGFCEVCGEKFSAAKADVLSSVADSIKGEAKTLIESQAATIRSQQEEIDRLKGRLGSHANRLTSLEGYHQGVLSTLRDLEADVDKIRQGLRAVGA